MCNRASLYIYIYIYVFAVCKTIQVNVVGLRLDENWDGRWCCCCCYHSYQSNNNFTFSMRVQFHFHIKRHTHTPIDIARASMASLAFSGGNLHFPMEIFKVVADANHCEPVSEGKEACEWVPTLHTFGSLENDGRAPLLKQSQSQSHIYIYT